MKKTYLFALILLALTFTAKAQQDFSKNLADARSSYSSGNLGDARFAMEQMLHEIDMALGKEILNMLPITLDARPVNETDDNVNGAGAGMAMGLYVHRTYGVDPKHAVVDIINNSPLINSITALFAIPFFGTGSDSDQKVVKIQGYKSLLTKSENTEAGTTGYQLQIPFNNTLFTLDIQDISEEKLLSVANSFPLAKIGQLAQ